MIVKVKKVMPKMILGNQHTNYIKQCIAYMPTLISQITKFLLRKGEKDYQRDTVLVSYPILTQSFKSEKALVAEFGNYRQYHFGFMETCACSQYPVVIE